MLTRKDLNVNQTRFLNQAALAAQHARRFAWAKYGREVLASVAIAQAIRETGWGKHTAGANNYFGLKAGKSWWGARVIRRTWEIIRGKRITVNAAFRAYPSMEASFIDYANHVATSRYYRKAVEVLAGGPPEDVVAWTDRHGKAWRTARWEAYARLIGGTWATDPAYSDAIVNLVKGLILRGWDMPLTRLKTKP